MLASGSEEASEASADTVGVVADSTAGAVTASLVTVSGKGIGAGGALLLVAGGAAVSSITEASHMLHGIPGGLVHASSFAGQMLLRPASSLVVTVVGAHGCIALHSPSEPFTE